MIKIAEKYAISFDKLNTVLHEKYEKRQGKGRDSPLSGVFAYREDSYHGTHYGVINKMAKLDAEGYNAESMEEFVEKVEQLKDEMTDILSKIIAEKSN